MIKGLVKPTFSRYAYISGPRKIKLSGYYRDYFMYEATCFSVPNIVIT